MQNASEQYEDHSSRSVTKARFRSIVEGLDSGSLHQATYTLNNGLAPGDIAHLLESSPPKQRLILWELLDDDLEGEVLSYLSDDIRSEFLRDMDAEAVLSIAEDFETDDFADLLQQLPEALIAEVLESMDTQDRVRIEEVLAFPEDSAGGLMTTDMITVRPDISVEVVLRYLRKHKAIPASTDNLLVVNRRDQFVGVLPISTLLVSNLNATVREIMQTDVDQIPPTMSENDVANLFERQDLISAPVVADSGRLLGRITIDDVVDVIRERANHEILSRAGLDEDEDMLAPFFKTAKSRAVWLGINLITAFLASAVIGMFEGTIDKVVALAVLMPIVASMGGIAGSQALTLVIRGMATGKVSRGNISWLTNREFLVGLFNGCIWALVVATAAIVWFEDLQLGAVIGAALIINMAVAGLAGTILPMVLQSMKIDPALAGGVILTTITDVVGFLSFLGLATIVYGF
ncbi:magnesium transporter [Allohahella marinimesophila]|uniref:Magnesium transporter MgtE n=1 Tax=Allohahella marinimesophila TaxID=1054972 RepID=A0ABP7PXP3_9GAMM